jgi:hypothetical protein
MGNVVKKSEDDELKKEYFKIIKNNFDEGMKRINSTMRNDVGDEHWIAYLENKISQYGIDTNNKFLQNVTNYLKSINDTEDAKYVYNLNIFIAKETDEEFIIRYNKGNLTNLDFMKSFVSLSKEDIISKAAVFIYEDLENLNHPLNLLIEQLRFNLSLSYERMFEQAELEVTYKNILSQMIIISVYLTEALIRFYDVRNTTNSKIYEIYYSKMSDILIRKDLYRVLFKYKEKIIDESNKKYQNLLMKYYNLKTNQLGISPYFALDKEFQYNMVRYSNYNLNSDYMNANFQPFQSSIMKYRNILDHDSILTKLDKIYELRGNILSEIDDSWKGVSLEPNLKLVDANNFQSIFIYIVIRGQIDSMFTHVKLVDDILSNNSKLSEKGYFYTLIQSAIEYLIYTIDENVISNFEKEYSEIVDKGLSSDSIFIN